METALGISQIFFDFFSLVQRPVHVGADGEIRAFGGSDRAWSHLGAWRTRFGLFGRLEDPLGAWISRNFKPISRNIKKYQANIKPISSNIKP